MAMIKKLAKWLSVLGVLLVATIAGLFLEGCRKAPLPRPEAPREQPPAKEPQKKEEPEKAGAQKKVDVEETEQGQPVPRNLLE